MSSLDRVRSARTASRRPAARILLAVLAAALVAGVTACGPSTTGAGGAGQGPATATLTDLDPAPIGPPPAPALPATVRSFDGADVTVSDASRIIAVDRTGTLTQIVWALGLGGNLVGRSTSAAFPAVQQVPNVAGGNGSINVEAVAAQRPTVFLTDTVSATPAMRDQLKALGITVVYFDPQRSLEGTGPQIEAVAAALGVPEQGKKLAQRTTDEIAAATAAVPPQDPKQKMAFLYLRSTAITMMAGPGSGADALIGALGGTDAGTAAGLKEQFTPITSEGMISASPDVFLVMTDGLKSIGGIEGLEKVPGIAQTPAGRNKRVIDMSDAAILSFGPNTGRVLAALTRAIYGPTA
ncbi:iron complex transport system substrate-binding protein [Nocardia transvalensis]|uniref:Iron complex transport system substrate-binding protein n=1 Tax=Nocardia transvalensis TaxID=37333 RepID=A0A7W9PIU5_9NOCA|nr:ABC transporter substrate-binding protein [Nocardia transvalensis]MBB5916498.1 iron complex transport system substrate-binding protein [Nocardia transvalensis]